MSKPSLFVKNQIITENQNLSNEIPKKNVVIPRKFS